MSDLVAFSNITASQKGSRSNTVIRPGESVEPSDLEDRGIEPLDLDRLKRLGVVGKAEDGPGRYEAGQEGDVTLPLTVPNSARSPEGEHPAPRDGVPGVVGSLVGDGTDLQAGGRDAGQGKAGSADPVTGGYDKANKGELIAEVDRRNADRGEDDQIVVERGDGEDGDPVVADYVEALKADDDAHDDE